MVGDKSDGDKKDFFGAARGFLADRIANVGFKPRVARIAAAAGISDLPILLSKALGDQCRRALQAPEHRRDSLAIGAGILCAVKNQDTPSPGSATLSLK